MNRYELLFMDDDDKMASPATPVETAEKTKPAASAAAAQPKAAAPKPAQSATKKGNAAAGEKENKASTLNKNDANKKGKVGAATRNEGNKARANNATVERTQGGGAGGAGGGLKPQNERREQRTYNNGNNNNNNNIANRRNVREGGGNSGGAGDFGNEQRAPRQFRDRDNRGPPRNRFENGGGGGSGFRGGKREFDRQSGSDKTGIKSVDKRDGAGAHNWGSAKQDIEDLNKSNNETDTALTDKDESANEQTTDAVAVAEEEESKEMTLDEWKALRQQRSKPEYNLRKAGEGEDTTQWKKMVVLNKKKDGTEEEEFEFDPSLYPQRVGRLQRIVDIQFNFKDGRRSGGGFGRGRGRGFGPRPEGGQRSGGERRDRAQGGEGGQSTTSGRPPRNALKVDDEHQFPTLS